MGLVFSTSDPVPLPSFTTGTPFVLIQIRAPLELSLSLILWLLSSQRWLSCCPIEAFAVPLQVIGLIAIGLAVYYYPKIGWILTCNFSHGNLAIVPRPTFPNVARVPKSYILVF
jgi:hypothetical protein